MCSASGGGGTPGSDTTNSPMSDPTIGGLNEPPAAATPGTRVSASTSPWATARGCAGGSRGRYEPLVKDAALGGRHRGRRDSDHQDAIAIEAKRRALQSFESAHEEA